MKRIAYTFSVIAVALLFAGCGGDSESTSKDASAAPDAAATAPADSQSSINNQDPTTAVTAFLNAMRSGDNKVAELLLTTKAREETAKQNMVVQPPGTPNASYKIGRVEYPKDQEATAYVECTWTEKYDDGQSDQYEVVWVLHQEKTGWHIAGMATELDNSGSIVFLNFENPAEMMEKVHQAEQMASQSPSVGTATTPPPTTASNPPAGGAVRR